MSRKPMDRTLSLDEEIEERLERLRSDKAETSVTDQKSIEERLAKLKGMDPNLYTLPPITVYQQTKHKTDSEKADDLLNQFSEELVIESKSQSFASNRRSSTDEDIERRLQRLRGRQSSDNKPIVSSVMDIDSESDEEREEKLIDRLLAETKLPSIPLDSNEEMAEMASDCLPWCQICNEDAVIKCVDCLGDLYCKQCFLDFHDDRDLRRHKTEAFRAPKSEYKY